MSDLASGVTELPAPATPDEVPPSLVLAGRALTKSYGRRVVVKHVDLQVATGEVVGLLGPNGAGKTTTFYMVVGLARPDSGAVLLGGDDITALPMYQRARAGIGYLPQEASVFRKLTAEQHVLAILETLGLPAHEQRERSRRLFSAASSCPRLPNCLRSRAT